MTPIDDVERFFRRLVEVLSKSDAKRLQSPIQISELYKTILPYRLHRSALGFDTNEDYEMAILRFLAGEGGFASLDPPEVQEALVEEARAVNPSPAAFREFAAAKVFLNSGAVRTVIEANEAYAPPPQPEEDAISLPFEVAEEPTEEPDDLEQPTAADEPDGEVDGYLPSEDEDEPASSEEAQPVASAPASFSGPSCHYCGGDVPQDRAVHFCPYCGRDLTAMPCPSCGTELELDWRFCITCGDPVQQ